MPLQSNRELETTRQKLSDLEHLYAQTLASSEEGGYARELRLRSLRRTINQLKEEIARFKARTRSATEND
jgi:hypothetical protein